MANLVDNALRYTPPGGSVILRVRAGGAGNETVLEVEDSGKGIPPAERERVLTPFYRVGAALESNPGGAGLGLAIVRDIAALHGARLELATAANGHGLKVGVYFSGVA
ncbi:Alkaline phosphatase synthesis sensor protein PhoR [compost metagenome]